MERLAGVYSVIIIFTRYTLYNLSLKVVSFQVLTVSNTPHVAPGPCGIIIYRKLILLWKSDCLGCAVLLCRVVCLTLLASFFLPSFCISH